MELIKKCELTWEFERVKYHRQYMIPSSTKHPSTEWAGLPIAIPSRPWTSTSSRRRSLFFAREVGISTNRQRKLPRSGSESPAMATVKTKVKTGPTQTSMQKTSARVFLYSLLLTLQYGVQPLISKRCIRYCWIASIYTWTSVFLL